MQFLAHFVPILTLQLQCLVHPFFDLCFADLLFASFWLKSCQINSHRFSFNLCSGVVVVFWLPPFVTTHQSAFGYQFPFLNLALLFLLDSVIDCVGFGFHCCPIWLLVLLDLAVDFAGSNSGFFIGF